MTIYFIAAGVGVILATILAGIIKFKRRKAGGGQMMDEELVRLQRAMNVYQDHTADMMRYAMLPFPNLTRWQRLSARIRMWMRKVRRMKP